MILHRLLFEACDDALARAKLPSLDELSWSADAVALVGSRANGCSVDESDWDVLVLGERNETLFADGVDLMYKNPNLASWKWNTMAWHALGYARWYKGGPTWTLTDLDHETAIADRLERIFIQAYDMNDELTLDPRHVTKLQNDIRRLEVLRSRGVQPPTALLPKLEDLHIVRAESDLAQKYPMFKFSPSLLEALGSTHGVRPKKGGSGV